MRRLIVAALLAATAAVAQQPTPSDVPANLVVEGVPVFPATLVENTQPYFDYRTASFASWSPARAEMLVLTAFGDAPQVHLVKMPLGMRRQLTFFRDRVGGRFFPNDPNSVLIVKDSGGNEQFQFSRFDVSTGAMTLLTDGKSRHTGAQFSRDGSLLAFMSNRRNGNDMDLYVLDPKKPGSDKLLLEMKGGGWNASDFSRDGSKLLLHEAISAEESYLWLLDTKTGEKKLLTPKAQAVVSRSGGTFSADDQDVYYTSDEGGEFSQLVRLHLADGKVTTISREPWEVEDFQLSDDRSRLVYVTNENGSSTLHAMEVATGKTIPLPQIPRGIIGRVEWHPKLPLLGFSITSARSPQDAYSIDVQKGTLVRWTESETGGLDPSRNVEPQLVTMKSFDGTQISAFVYRPDAARFPGKRPVVVNIHGGPEGQARPGFLGRTNYWINELGIAMVYPNVRGSTGYGKTYLSLDNGRKREDSVKDIGAVLDWIGQDAALDASRVAVYGGSYGGYMSLASMTHYNDRLRAGIDLVGISNFLTFMQNTSGYRRDLRRVEYGDERDPAMHDFMAKISPQASATNITKPLFVIAGFNDPRVPWTEGQQMVQTVRGNGGPVWWLMAKDEGHGFAKKPNIDYQFRAMTEFWENFLLK